MVAAVSRSRGRGRGRGRRGRGRGRRQGRGRGRRRGRGRGRGRARRLYPGVKRVGNTDHYQVNRRALRLRPHHTIDTRPFHSGTEDQNRKLAQILSDLEMICFRKGPGTLAANRYGRRSNISLCNPEATADFLLQKWGVKPPRPKFDGAIAELADTDSRETLQLAQNEYGATWQQTDSNRIRGAFMNLGAQNPNNQGQHYRAFGISDDEVLVCAAIVRVNPGTGIFLEDIMTESAYQYRGCGIRMMRHIRTTLPEATQSFGLTVEVDKKHTRAWYTKLGFREIPSGNAVAYHVGALEVVNMELLHGAPAW